MLKVKNKIYLSWDDLEGLVDKLCEKIITELPNIDSVYGIPRGGLIPAVMISHKLGLPFAKAILPNTLVIDDIADSGITLKNTVGCYTAVLHYKPHTSCFKPNIYAEKHDGNEWIIYPFERKDSNTLQDYLNENEDKFAHLADGSYIGGLTMPKENTNKLNR